MCPPGTDQTTRTSQRWTLMTPYLQEQYNITGDLDTSSSRDLVNFLNSDFTWDALDKLARRADISHRLADLQKNPFSCHPRSTTASAVEKLPVELLSMIFLDDGLSTNDVVALGLASQTLWLQVLSYIQQKCHKASWVGTPLLCTGTWLMSVPQLIHALEPSMRIEETSFFKPRPSVRGGSSIPSGRGTFSPFAPSRGMCPARRWNWDARGTYVDRSVTSFEDEVREAFIHATKGAGICLVDVTNLRSSLEYVLSDLKVTIQRTVEWKGACSTGEVFSNDPSPRWVLRNLTTKEYFKLTHRTVSSSEDRYLHVQGLPSLSLDKALLLRISWSAEYKLRRNGEENEFFLPKPISPQQRLEQGEWAGHCFDVVNVLEEKPLSQEWKDVTAEMIDESKAWEELKGE